MTEQNDGPGTGNHSNHVLPHDLPGVFTDAVPRELFPEVGHPKQRAFLQALAVTASVTRACEYAGISRKLPYSPSWRRDPAFMRAQDRAIELAAETMEEEARRRAVRGVRRYQFTKSGDVIRHPTRCECGHDARLHPRLDADSSSPRACTHPDCRDASHPCPDFIGAPYYEHEYSDTLLIFLLKGAMPEKYTKRVELRGLFANLDMTKLPDAVVGRIAAGENPIQVVIEAANAAGTNPAGILGLSAEVDPPDDAPMGMDEYEPPGGEL